MTTHSPEFTEDACLRWMNKQLAKASPPLTISILTEPNVRNGVAIGLLLETIGHMKLNGLLLQPETRVEHLHNVHELFALLRQINVRLGTIQPENVMNGDKEAILQLVQAISSHFMRHPKGRPSVSPHPCSTNGNRATVYHNGSSGSMATSRPPSNRRYQTVKARRDLSSIGDRSNGSAPSHHGLGSAALHEEGRTKSCTALTVMFNGRCAENGVCHLEISQDHREQNGTATLMNGRIPKFEPSFSSQGGDLSPTNPSNSAVLNSRLPFAPLDYVESMKELAELRMQLNAISKLISSDNPTLPTDKQPAMFPTRGVQTESCPDVSNSAEMQKAHEKIAELTRILHEKDRALCLTEQENSRLSDLLRTAQLSTHNSGASSNFSSSESRDFQSSCSSSVLPKPQKRRTAMHMFPLDSPIHGCHISLADYCRREQAQHYAESRERSWDFPPGTTHHIPDLATN